MRNRVILIAGAFVVVAIVWFVLLWRPTQSSINNLRKQQDQARTQRTQAEAEVRRLRGLQEQEPKLRADFARLQDALPTDPRLPDFILQVQEAASLAGIDFIQIQPSLPAAFTATGGAAAPSATAAPGATTGGGRLQAITVSIQTSGQFFEIEDFIVRMERLRRAVRVNTITLTPASTTGTESPTLTVAFQMQMFLVGAVAAPPAAGATPAPGASPTPTPAPGASPTPATGASPTPGA